MWDKDSINALLMSNDKAMERAIVLLYHRQTQNEQQTQSTRVHNERGFRPCHARMFTSFAIQILRYKRNLTEKQLDYARYKDKKGYCKLAIYWRQLIEEIELKNERKAQAA